jgi:hypothetical protein
MARSISNVRFVPILLQKSILSLHKSDFLEPYSKRVQPLRIRFRRFCANESNHRESTLLRVSEQRPAGCRTTNEPYELTPFHSITSSARASRPAGTLMPMVAFTDSQLRAVWAAADRVPFEKRGVFIERVVARLQMQRGFTDADLDDAVRAALTGLVQSAA